MQLIIFALLPWLPCSLKINNNCDDTKDSLPLTLVSPPSPLSSVDSRSKPRDLVQMLNSCVSCLNFLPHPYRQLMASKAKETAVSFSKESAPPREYMEC